MRAPHSPAVQSSNGERKSTGAVASARGQVRQDLVRSVGSAGTARRRPASFHRNGTAAPSRSRDPGPRDAHDESATEASSDDSTSARPRANSRATEPPRRRGGIVAGAGGEAGPAGA